MVVVVVVDVVDVVVVVAVAGVVAVDVDRCCSFPCLLQHHQHLHRDVGDVVGVVVVVVVVSCGYWCC